MWSLPGLHASHLRRWITFWKVLLWLYRGIYSIVVGKESYKVTDWVKKDVVDLLKHLSTLLLCPLRLLWLTGKKLHVSIFYIFLNEWENLVNFEPFDFIHITLGEVWVGGLSTTTWHSKVLTSVFFMGKGVVYGLHFFFPKQFLEEGKRRVVDVCSCCVDVTLWHVKHFSSSS